MRIRSVLSVSAFLGIASVTLVAASIIVLQFQDARHTEVTLNLNAAVRKISLIRGFLPELSSTSYTRAEKQWHAQYVELTPVLESIPPLDRQTQSLKVRILENHVALGQLFDTLIALDTGSDSGLNDVPERQLIQEQLDARTASMVSDILLLNDVSATYINAEKRWIHIALVISAVLLAAVMFGLLQIFYRRIVSPVLQLEEATKRFGSGQLDAPISISGNDEITSLAVSFESMRIALSNRLAELDASNANIKIEINERKLAAELLEKSVLKIQFALKEKELMLGEIHHRVKNNLQIIHSLLSLQSSRISDPVVKGMLLDSQNRIQSMALIHSTLYQFHDFAKVDFSQFLNVLVKSLVSSYGLEEKHIRMHVEAMSVQLPINQAIPCGLIVNELITNTLKHAFPDNQSGDIFIVMKRLENKRVLLDISDTGVGIPVDLDIHKLDSLGLQLVSMLAMQIGGTLAINRVNPTRFSIEWTCDDLE